MKAMVSAESLLEQTDMTVGEKLTVAEEHIIHLEAECATLQTECATTSRRLVAAQQNLKALMADVRPALQFALCFADQFDEKQQQRLRRIVNEHAPADEESAVPTVSIPQQAFFQTLDELQQIQTSAQGLRVVAQDQAQFIQQQSVKLDSELERFDKVSETVKARDHEIMLLEHSRKSLVQKLAETKEALHEAGQDCARNEKVQVQMHKIAQQHEKRIEDQDHAIFRMRQELDEACEQLNLARAKLQEAESRGYQSTTRPMHKIPARIPASASAFALGVQQLQQASSARPQRTYNIVGPRSNLAAPQQADLVSVRSSNLSDSIHHRKPSDPFRSSPRAANIGKPPNRLIIRRPRDNDKPLPSPPTTISPTIPATAILGRGQATVHGHPAMATFRFPFTDSDEPSTPPTSPGKRMLSLIAEASHEDSDSARSVSVTSSQKETYRRSINALDLLNSQSSPHDKKAMHDEQMSPIKHRVLKKVASHDLSLAQLYHHGHKHL